MALGEYKAEIDGRTWTRRSWTTRCSDPTTVVEWTREDGAKLTEFQNVVLVDDAHSKELGAIDSPRLRGLHFTLEATYSLLEDVFGDDAFDAEVAQAERRAGWDPRP